MALSREKSTTDPIVGGYGEGVKIGRPRARALTNGAPRRRRYGKYAGAHANCKDGTCNIRAGRWRIRIRTY